MQLGDLLRMALVKKFDPGTEKRSENVSLIYHNQVYLDQRIMKIGSQYLVAEGKTVKIKTRQIQFWKMTDLMRSK